MKFTIDNSSVILALVLSGCASTSTPTSSASSLPSAATSTSTSSPSVATTPPTIKATVLAAGLYQSSYSARNGTLWVTASTMKPTPASALIKIDARTEQVTARYAPPVVDPATGKLEAVFGVAVDDAHDNVWVTNTLNNSVAVYRQIDGAHLATLPDVGHSREVIVDEARNVAWASAFGGAALVAFDTDTLKEKRRIKLEGSGPAGLALDRRSGTLYAADLKKNQIIEISSDHDTPRFLPTGEKSTSIALSRDGRTAFTADQGSGTLSVVDLEKGVVRGTIPTGKGALCVAVDPASGKVLVANRGASTISVVDVDKNVVTDTLPTNANPNHIGFGGGAAWVVDKSAAGPDGKDTLYRVTLGR